MMSRRGGGGGAPCAGPPPGIVEGGTHRVLYADLPCAVAGHGRFIDRQGGGRGAGVLVDAFRPLNLAKQAAGLDDERYPAPGCRPDYAPTCITDS